MTERVPILRNEAKPSGENGTSSNFALSCTRYIRYFLQQVRKKNAKLCLKAYFFALVVQKNSRHVPRTSRVGLGKMNPFGVRLYEHLFSDNENWSLSDY